MLDLFSGLKGASAAFILDPGWEVVTLDNNPDLEANLCLDLSTPAGVGTLLGKFPKGHFDLIWASPPCVEFYQVGAPWFHNYREPPDMTLVRNTHRIINHFRPGTWVVENTMSGSRFVRQVLGKPRQRIGPFIMWGTAPLLPDVQIAADHKAQVDPGSHHPMRSNVRARIPLQLSEALLSSLEAQRTLDIDLRG